MQKNYSLKQLGQYVFDLLLYISYIHSMVCLNRKDPAHLTDCLMTWIHQ